MKPVIIAKGVKLTSALRNYIVRRLDFALDRMRHSIQFVMVRIDDQNGPKGGIDKRCQIHLALPGLPTIVIDERAADLIAAVNQASHRAAHAAGRLHSRAKEIARTKYNLAAPEEA